MAQLVKHLTLAQVVISQLTSSSRTLVSLLSVVEPALDPLSTSLCPTPALSLSLSVSLSLSLSLKIKYTVNKAFSYLLHKDVTWYFRGHD